MSGNLFSITIKVEKIADGKFKTTYNTEGVVETRDEYMDALLNAVDAISRMFQEKCVRLSMKVQ